MKAEKKAFRWVVLVLMVVRLSACRSMVEAVPVAEACLPEHFGKTVQLPGHVGWAENTGCYSLEGEMRCELHFNAQEGSAITFFYASVVVGEGRNEMLPVESCDPTSVVTMKTASGEVIEDDVRLLLQGELTDHDGRCVLMVDRIKVAE